LVLASGNLLTIDGAHKLPSREWAALAESERTGTVTIAKAAKDQAYARTRSIKIGNPLDRETWDTRKMSDFLHSITALASVLDKVSIARLDLAVFAKSNDVAIEEVNKIQKLIPDSEFDFLPEVRKWSSDTNLQIEFTEEAQKLILSEATRMYRDYHYDDIPLVTIDQKMKLARLSVSLAKLLMSTKNDLQTVQVKEEHVRKVVSFMEEEYLKSGLKALAKDSRADDLGPEEAILVFKRIKESSGSLDDQKPDSIIRYIVAQARFTKAQLKDRFELSDKNELRPLLQVLQDNGLVKVGKGLYATGKMNDLYRIRNPSVFATVDTSAPPKIDTPQKQETKELVEIPRVSNLSKSNQAIMLNFEVIDKLKKLPPFHRCLVCHWDSSDTDEDRAKRHWRQMHEEAFENS